MPRPTSATAMARPIPRAPPVTAATLPWSERDGAAMAGKLLRSTIRASAVRGEEPTDGRDRRPERDPARHAGPAVRHLRAVDRARRGPDRVLGPLRLGPGDPGRHRAVPRRAAR